MREGPGQRTRDRGAAGGGGAVGTRGTFGCQELLRCLWVPGAVCLLGWESEGRTFLSLPGRTEVLLGEGKQFGFRCHLGTLGAVWEPLGGRSSMPAWSGWGGILKGWRKPMGFPFHSNWRSAGMLGEGKRFGGQAGNGLGAFGHPEQCACSTGRGRTPERAGGSSEEPSWGIHCTWPQGVFWGQGLGYLPSGGSSALRGPLCFPTEPSSLCSLGTLPCRDSSSPLLSPNTCGSSLHEEWGGSCEVPGIGNCLASPAHGPWEASQAP